MNKKAIILGAALLVAVLLIGGYEIYSRTNADDKSNTSALNGSETGTGSEAQMPEGHPSIDGSDTGSTSSGSSTPIDGKEVADKIVKALDEKFPGEFTVSGTDLKKGSYTENNNYKMVDEVLKLYPGSMVSIFVGEDRVSSSIKGEDGKPVTEGYPTPAEVGETMKSGQVKVVDAGSMGSTSYQKVYMPLKSGDKTVAVMTISVAQ